MLKIISKTLRGVKGIIPTFMAVPKILCIKGI